MFAHVVEFGTKSNRHQTVDNWSYGSRNIAEPMCHHLHCRFQLFIFVGNKKFNDGHYIDWKVAKIVNNSNRNHHLDSRLQFDYFLNTIRKKKRYSKWLKSEKLQDLDVVKEYYGFGNEKAKDVLRTLSGNQLAFIKDKLNQGGAEK